MNAKDLKDYELKEKKHVKVDDMLPVVLLIWLLGVFGMAYAIIPPYDFWSGVAFVVSVIIMVFSFVLLFIQESEFVLVRKE